MVKKLNFVNAVLALLLFLFPFQSFTISIGNNTLTQQVGLYISGQYKPSISYFKNFSVAENNKIVDLIGLDTGVTYITETTLQDDTKFNIPYIAKFKNNFTNFSSAIGYYSGQGLRLEIEGSYGNFDVVNCKNCVVKDANRYFALVREKKTDAFSPKAHDGTNGNKTSYYTFMKNNGISIASVMMNSCYDFSFNNLKISPYVCVGIGGDFIEFFEATYIKFACQSKIGINYIISPSISIFTDGYYHKVINNQFKNLHVKYPYTLKNSPTITSATVKLNLGYFGGEVGMRFIF
ncbi:P44/Msp2 family outer membrane protein [Ehrlichia japonica]|uniref:Surface antigen family protein n=1 Tax=Ehrlichia japonica TaxID=391036 RepID=X5GLS6_9RICK|nr:P44/Msp2 family outer membrane protein [Ehrlichia japonica]AHX05091.1 surface antigen family protein [Ehrlichia japonica]